MVFILNVSGEIDTKFNFNVVSSKQSEKVHRFSQFTDIVVGKAVRFCYSSICEFCIFVKIKKYNYAISRNASCTDAC